MNTRLQGSKWILFFRIFWFKCVCDGASVVAFCEVIINLVGFLFLQVFFFLVFKLVVHKFIVTGRILLIPILISVFVALQMFIFFSEKQLTFNVVSWLLSAISWVLLTRAKRVPVLRLRLACGRAVENVVCRLAIRSWSLQDDPLLFHRFQIFKQFLILLF